MKPPKISSAEEQRIDEAIDHINLFRPYIMESPTELTADLAAMPNSQANALRLIR